MKPNIIGVVFSRDRAMQLDGTLRSFLLHCMDAYKVEITVIYKASSIPHKIQYERLQNYYSKFNVDFMEEDSFRNDLIQLLNGFVHICQTFWLCINMLRTVPLMGVLDEVIHKYNHKKYVLLLVDDNLFVRDFSLDTAINAISKHSDAIGFSLRLGKNIKLCYTSNSHQSIPPFEELTSDIIKFNWTSAIGDFAYPLEVSSSIYRIHDILPFLNYWRFNNPNTLETVLAGKTRFFTRRQPFLLCYSKSVTFCNPINKVQNGVSNRAGSRTDYSAENLMRMFDQGYRIDVEKLTHFIPNSCHQEVEIPIFSCQTTD